MSPKPICTRLLTNVPTSGENDQEADFEIMDRGCFKTEEIPVLPPRYHDPFCPKTEPVTNEIKVASKIVFVIIINSLVPSGKIHASFLK